jgi:hypothetical protein
MTTEIRTGQPIKLTSAGAFWYVLMNIALGAGYLAKVPMKRALAQAGLAEMTAAEKFWYVLQNIFFGSGYFAKVIAVKALSEATQHDIGADRAAS